MTATILQFRDYQQPKDLERMYSEFANQVAVEIANVALIPHDRETDTSPCEMSQDSGDCA